MSWQHPENVKDELLAKALNIAVSEIGIAAIRDKQTLSWHLRATKTFNPGIGISLFLSSESDRPVAENLIYADIELLDELGDIYQSERVASQSDPIIYDSDYSRDILAVLTNYPRHPHDICLSAFRMLFIRSQESTVLGSGLAPEFSGLTKSYVERMTAAGIKI